MKFIIFVLLYNFVYWQNKVPVNVIVYPDQCNMLYIKNKTKKKGEGKA
jgi:hypothetical protein